MAAQWWNGSLIYSSLCLTALDRQKCFKNSDNCGSANDIGEFRVMQECVSVPLSWSRWKKTTEGRISLADTGTYAIMKL
jgi:hypothetical protein